MGHWEAERWYNDEWVWGFEMKELMMRNDVVFSGRGWVAGVMVMAVVSASGFAQVQVQQNNPLDANPQVGSGGSNAPVPGYVPVNGNDIVTGNVSGLKYFHAPTATVRGPGGVLIPSQSSSVGTFSPYQFQGSQGSAAFNSFARQSAGGSQANIGTDADVLFAIDDGFDGAGVVV